MHSRVRSASVAACVALVVVLPVTTARAYAVSPQSASCAGDTETISWTAPQNDSGLSGYAVQDYLTNSGDDGGIYYELNVPPTVASTEVTLGPGWNDFVVYPVTSSGIDYSAGAVTSADLVGGTPPEAMLWAEDPSDNRVGDHTATVTFIPDGPLTAAGEGYTADELTVSDGATTVGAQPGSPVTFTGLRNGQAYVFTAGSANTCGSTTSGPSPTFVPGVAPSWISDSPSLVFAAGSYHAWFHASGDPNPSYQLVGAPSWLHLVTAGVLGYVYGLVPRGTSAFSYSVSARNGVGVGPGELGAIYPSTDLTAGPFVVRPASPARSASIGLWLSRLGFLTHLRARA